MASFYNLGDVGNQVGRDQVFKIHHVQQVVLGNVQPVQQRVAWSTNTLKQDAILASLAFPQMFDRRSNIETPHNQTCQWILTSYEYEQWRSQPSGLLWIKGKPGAGKSTLMSFLYKHICQERSVDNTYLDFFFSARGSELQRTPLGMVRSLLNQIFRQDFSVQHLVEAVYDEKCAAFGHRHHDWHWQRRELEVLLTNVIIASARTKPVEVFIDALDEAGEQSAREMARYFHDINNRLSNSHSAFKICISCRHYPVVSTSSSIELCVEDHNSNDISFFIRDRLHLYKEHISDVSAFSQLAKNLAIRSRGVFQWITLIMLMVEKSIVDGESLEVIQDELEHVPQELSDVYRYILQNVIDEKHRAKSFSLFQWVCLAKRPLSILELRDALTAEDTNASTAPKAGCHKYDCVPRYNISRTSIRALSGGLLEVQQSESRYNISRTFDKALSSDLLKLQQSESVQVIHQSVNDFLLSQGLIFLNELISVKQTRHKIPVSHEDAISQDLIHPCQGRIYRACLNYLITPKVEALIPRLCYPDDASQTVAISAQEVNAELLSGCPLLEYAAEFIFVHAEDANGCRGMHIQDEIQLLDQILPNWVRAYQTLHGFWLKTLSSGRTTLHIAVIINAIDMVECLVNNGIDIDKVDEDGYAAVHYAAQRGHLSCIKVISAAGANIDINTKRAGTPLVLAASGGHISVVQWLLEKGARLNAVTGRNGSAICAAAASGSTLMVQILIDAGAAMNGQDIVDGITKASSKGFESIVRLLLKYEPGGNAEEKYGDALVYASRGGYGSIVRLLIEHGVDVNAKHHWSALSNASEQGHISVVHLLLEHGADVNGLGGALSRASRNGHLSIAHMLIKHGADVNMPLGYDSPLAFAAVGGHESLVSLLIEKGAVLNDTFDGRQSSALELASREDHWKVMKILREAGARALYY